MRTLTAIGAFIAFTAIYWLAALAVFGQRGSTFGFVALAINLALLALGRQLFDRIYPKPARSERGSR